MYDIVIVGAGTAGLSAAIYGVRAGKTVLVLEALTYGGQIVSSAEVENYPGIAHISGFEFATGLYEQAKGLGAEVRFLDVLSVEKTADHFQVITEDGALECRAVILATGAKNRPLGVEREAMMVGAGLSYCATCDGAFFRDRVTAVVGGGNTALEDAQFLSGYCKKVYLIHRRDAFRGDDWMVRSLQAKENVEFVLDSVVTELLGETAIEGVRIRNKKTGEISDLAVDGLFVAIGQMPENSRFSPLVELDAGGYNQAGEDCETSCEGIFAAGDCRTKTVRQLATAAADGAVAALAACQYINEKTGR